MRAENALAPTVTGAKPLIERATTCIKNLIMRSNHLCFLILFLQRNPFSYPDYHPYSRILFIIYVHDARSPPLLPRIDILFNIMHIG